MGPKNTKPVAAAEASKRSNAPASHTASDNRGTKTFNKSYLLARELGTGAFSVVKLGVNKATGESVAVKIVSKKKLSDEDLKALWMENRF